MVSFEAAFSGFTHRAPMPQAQARVRKAVTLYTRLHTKYITSTYKPNASISSGFGSFGSFGRGSHELSTDTDAGFALSVTIRARTEGDADEARKVLSNRAEAAAFLEMSLSSHGAGACTITLTPNIQARQCNQGYKGLLCRVCDTPVYMKQSNGSCKQCEEGEGMRAAANAAALLFGMLAAASALYYLFARWRAKVLGMGVKDVTTLWIKSFLDAVQERSTVFKILISFVQVCTRLGDQYKLTLPRSVNEFFSAVQAVFEFMDVGRYVGNLNCAFAADAGLLIVTKTFGYSVIILVLALKQFGFFGNQSKWRSKLPATCARRKRPKVHNMADSTDITAGTLVHVKRHETR